MEDRAKCTKNKILEGLRLCWGGGGEGGGDDLKWVWSLGSGGVEWWLDWVVEVGME